LHTLDGVIIYHYREFLVLSAVCVPSSQRRHHTIEIVHIHRTSSALLGTMMAPRALPAAAIVAHIHQLIAAAMCLPFAPFLGRCHRGVCREMFAFGDVFRGWFGRDNQQHSEGRRRRTTRLCLDLFVLVFGVLFEAMFQLYHNTFQAQKAANNAATERYEDGWY
jgi:hypothetical protein